MTWLTLSTNDRALTLERQEPFAFTYHKTLSNVVCIEMVESKNEIVSDFSLSRSLAKHIAEEMGS